MPFGDSAKVDVYTGRGDENQGDGGSIIAPQRYWEDVSEGDTVPGFSHKINWTRICMQVSGSQDFYPVHHDPQFARDAGHEEMFINTGWYQANFGRIATSFAGDEGWVRKFRMEMRRMNQLGDVSTWGGKVSRKYVSDEGDHCVDLDLFVENDRHGVTTPAQATVILPSKG
jgi:hypothetical protein